MAEPSDTMTWEGIIGHDRPKQILKEAIVHSKIAHAYLFYGADAIGKMKTAMVFARTLQCEGPEPTRACGSCRSCHAVASGSHPDVFAIVPEGSQIKIDQVRSVQSDLVYKPLSGQRKILILDEADAMNAEAANCFLKTLEEPPDHSLIILVTSRPNRLPPTILSRCQQVRFEPASPDVLAQHLAEAQHLTRPQAELLASLSLGQTGQALSGSLAEIAAARDRALSLLEPRALHDLHLLFENAQSASGDPDHWMKTLDWIQIWLRDALVLRYGGKAERIVNRDRPKELMKFNSRYSALTVIRIFSLIEAVRRSVNRNLNRPMALESVLLELRRPLIETGP